VTPDYSQEYELVFVEVLPPGYTVVDPSAIDPSAIELSNNPAGALAFRYKHGWHLINPLIPSRGLSGGGLARQHGHLSGGYTTGHFHKGADGKVHFKAANRYADKADWEKEVKAGAAGVAAKQEAAKAAVQKAEDATSLTEKLAGEKAPKAAQAAAHAAAAAAHQDAVKQFQAMGQDGLKSGVLTHSAHSAIHASKADQLGSAAKAEKAQKLIQRKELATGLSKKANNLSFSSHGSTALPKDKAALHQKAAAAHTAAQKAHELAGNPNTAETHGMAAAKHETLAAHQLEKHKQLEHGAGVKSNKAVTASKSAHIAGEEGDSLPSQIAAHQHAAQAHGEASAAHNSLGNIKAAQDHLTSKMAHNGHAAQLKEKHAKHEAATAEHNQLKGAANAAYQKAIGMPEGTVFEKTAKADALKEASEKTGAAIQHGAKHGLPDDQLITAKHEQLTDFAKQLTGEVEQEHKATAKLNQAAFDATDKAKAASLDAQVSGALADHWAAHDAHQAAAEAGQAAGHGADIQQFHAKQKEAHLDKIAKIQEEQDAAKKAAAEAKKAAQLKAIDMSDAAKAASLDAENTPHGKTLVGKHLDAAAAHLDAADAAKDASGGAKLVEHHTAMAKEHTATAKKVSADVSKADQTAGDHFNKGDDAETTGDHSAAVQHYKKAAEEADKAGNITLKANALHSVANITGTKEDHKAAGKAALKVQIAENKKAKPSEFIQNKYENMAEEHLAAIDAGSTAPKASEAPAQAEGKVLKPVGKLTGTGKQLGSHANEVLVDEAGNQWLKKADAKGYSRVLDPALASLQRKVGIETPVFVKTKEGHLQGMIPGAADAFPGGKFDPEKLSPEDVTKMLQHQVLDFATGNQDTHSGQWLRNPDGSLTQIDQAQAFKFGVGKGSGGYGKGDPTTTYPPNHPDTEVYPKLWAAAQAGKIEIPDPSGDNEFAKTIQAIQDMPDEQFKALFKPYATQVVANGGNPGGHATVDEFLNAITEHKNSIGSDFQKLYNKLPESSKISTAAPEAPEPHVPTGATADTKKNALEAIQTYAVSGNGQPLTPWMTQMAKEAGLTDAEIHQAFKDGPKDIALQEVAKQAANGTLLNSGAITKAKDAGASLKEIHEVIQAAKNPAPASGNSGLSKKEQALKALAEHEQSDGDIAKGGQLEKAAVAAGASQQELVQAAHHPETYLKSLEGKTGSAAPATAPEPSGLSAKQEALKKVAEFSSNPPEDWTVMKFQEVQKAAKAAGASPAEVQEAKYTPEKFLKSLPAAAPSVAAPSAPAAVAPAAPSAPAGPKVDPFKPQAKWTKGVAGLKMPSGETQETDVVAGPKGLVVHKTTNGPGWTVSSSDGLSLGNKFKTQKEAKLAAEWMAKNHGATGAITLDNHKAWGASHPEELTKFKQGVVNSQWNKDAQATLDAHNGMAPAGTAAPAAMTAKEDALKKLAEHNLPENGDDWDYDKNADLKDSASAAGASPAEIASAAGKPKTYIKSLGNAAAATPASPSTPGHATLPSTPAGQTGWKKTTHPVTGNAAYVHPESGIHISKKPYGTMWQLSTPSGAVIGVQYSLKDAKHAAAQLTKPFTPGYSKYQDEIKLKQVASAFGKDSKAFKDAETAFKDKHGSVPEVQPASAPKPYTPGSPQAATVKKQPPNPVTDAFTITGSQSKDAHNLKAILAANGPTSPKFLNAKAEWEKKYGKTFDPSFKSPYAATVHPAHAGFTPSNPKSYTTQDSQDPAELAKVTKMHWSQDTLDQGFRSASITASLNGDWKPKHEDTGDGSGPMIYSGGSYDAINNQLRGDAQSDLMPIGPTGGDWDDVIAHADKLFDEVPPLTQNVVLSRKVGSDGGAFPKSPPPMTPGAVFTDHGYVSTSKSRDVWSGPVQMEVRVPKGMKVLDLNHTTGSNHPSELEVLLPRGVRYRVISDGPALHYSGAGQQNRHIVVEVLPPLPNDSAIN
jgi:hypothetical protein